MAEINIIQCNLQKARLAQLTLNGKISKANKKGERFICLIQEPYVGKNRIALQPNTCKKYVISRTPRSVIYTDSATNAWLVEDLSTPDIVVIHTKIRNMEMLIASVYLDYNDKGVIPPALEKLVEYADSKQWGLLIGMDSNCHSVLFGHETNTRGEKLKSFIAETGLVVENIGRQPTYESRGNSTCIDVTLTKNLSHVINSWTVDRTYNASDHNTVTFKIGCEAVHLPRVWKWHKANWEKFSDTVNKYKHGLPKLIKDEDCEKEVSRIYKTINHAMKISIPKSKPTTVDKNNPWWSKELKDMRNRVSKLYKRKNLSPTTANINLYKETQRSYKKACEKARLNSWRALQQGIDNIQDMNNFRKIIGGNQKITLGTLTKNDGSITDPGEDTLTYLLQQQFKDSQPLTPTVYTTNTIKRKDIENWDPDWITPHKLQEVFNGFKSKKSPGTDNLSPLVLKNLPLLFLKQLTFLFKCMIKLHFTPTKWKESKLIFIPKPGKDSYKFSKSWRAISLTNYILKALEKLCCWHSDEKIAQNPLHIRQHGFRTDRNTDTALSNVTNYIEKFINNEQHVLGVFLDIQAAFDTISPEKIRQELIKYGIDKDMAQWYYNYITHRNMYASINDSTKAITTKTGFPQGGVCSAKFWIIAFNDAIEIINKLGIYGTGFADDCAALVGGTNLHQLMSRMQKVVSEVEEWGKQQGLIFNPLKTEVIIFTKARLKDQEIPNKLIIGNTTVNYGHQVKYLGVMFDSKLNWILHLNDRIDKAKQTLFMLRNATSKKWGPKPKHMKWAYNAIVKPRITYGAVIWGPILRKASYRDKLNKLNFLAASMLCNVRRSTPRLALEIVLDLPPLDLVIMYEAISTIARNKTVMVRDWPGFNKLRENSNWTLKILGRSIQNNRYFHAGNRLNQRKSME